MPNCPIKRIIKAIETLEGGGFRVRRPFPTQYFSEWDPFLLIDEFSQSLGPQTKPSAHLPTLTGVLKPSAISYKDTPHTVDSLGHSGELHPGDIQWMTAGSELFTRSCRTQILPRWAVRCMRSKSGSISRLSSSCLHLVISICHQARYQWSPCQMVVDGSKSLRVHFKPSKALSKRAQKLNF